MATGSERARGGAGFVAAAVTLALVVGGVWWSFGRGGDGSGDDAEQAGSQVPTDRAECTSLVVASSPEKYDVLSTLATEYNDAGREVGGACSWVEVTRPSSGAAAAALARGWDEQTDGPRPDVWSPAASS
ncbi:MAG: hypothetical protein ACRDVO_08250 [Jiangellaceae bacterium]